MKKGFTLVELLAVIVILAIIALITVPIIMNIVESSRKSSATASAYGYIDGVKIMYAKEMLSGSDFTLDGKFNVDAEGKLEGHDVEVEGTKAKGGYLTYSDGKITEGCLTIGDYKVTIENDTAKETVKGACDSSSNGDESGTNVVFNDGREIYFNVDTGEECTVEDYEAAGGLEVQSKTGNKQGCMKFYAFLDSEDSETVNLLLDHNTTAEVKWNSSLNNTEGPSTEDGQLLSQLNKDTENWHGTEIPKNYLASWEYDNQTYNYTVDYSKYKARLITTEEIAKIVKKEEKKLEELCDDSCIDSYGTFDITNGEYCDSYIYDDSASEVYCVSPNFATGGNYNGGIVTYGWLFDNLSIGSASCIIYGCKNGQIDDSYNYWTASPYVCESYVYDNIIYYSWVVSYDGTANNNNIGGLAGIRPVIEVSKSKLSNS